MKAAEKETDLKYNIVYDKTQEEMYIQDMSFTNQQIEDKIKLIDTQPFVLNKDLGSDSGYVADPYWNGVDYWKETIGKSQEETNM